MSTDQSIVPKTDEPDEAGTDPNEYAVTLSMEGLPKHKGQIRLNDLIGELQSLKALLVGIDRAVSPDNNLSTLFTILDLRRSNPSEVTVAGTPKANAPDVRSFVFAEPFNTIARIEEGRESGYDYDLLEDLRALVAPVGKRLQTVTLVRNGQRSALTPPLRERIDSLLQPHYTDYGFIQGRLEAANVHAGANTFKLYPRCGPKKLTGTFPTEMRETVGAALGRDVIVQGVLKYRTEEQYAHAVTVESMKILPEASAAPSFGQFAGAFGDLTDGMSSEEWLEKRRAEKHEELLALMSINP